MTNSTHAFAPNPSMAWAIDTESRRFTSSEYGKEFDEQAKNRMHFGASLLNPILLEFRDQICGKSLEVGPFTNPLLHPDKFKAQQLTYLDADSEIVAHLNALFANHQHVEALHIDLNEVDSIPLGLQPGSYDAIVISQVLNYLDLNKTLSLITALARDNTHLFINNVIDYGIPELFHPNRPHNDEQIEEALIHYGWSIVRHLSIPSHFAEQYHPRTIIVACRTMRAPKDQNDNHQ